MAEHDGSYKQIFSHASVVKDLLCGFVHEDWAADIDYDTLEKVNGSYVTDDLRQRSDDLVWRVKFKGQWLYLYLLIEFQSTVDNWMALRMLVYVGLLYQDLIKTGVIGNAETLPPVLPMVIYNGESRWTAARDVSQLIASVSGPLSAYQPKLKYWLLDEGRVNEADLPSSSNTVADIIRLENSPEPDNMRIIIARLTQHLAGSDYDSLRRALVVWIKRVLLKKLQPEEDINALNDLQEINTMLAERVEQWTTHWMQQGMAKGIEQGREQGIEQGRKQECRALLARLIRRKFGINPSLEGLLGQLDHYALNDLEALADALLDFNDIQDVHAWLDRQSASVDPVSTDV